jgi:oligopeptide transport system substrate-binding protein
MKDHAIIPIYFYTTQNMIDLDKWGGWYKAPLGVHHWKYIYRK